MSNEELPSILTVTDAPGSEAEEVIEGGLAKFNEDNAGYRDTRPLAVLVSDPDTKAVVGGLLGRTSLGLLFIDLFFVPASLRKSPAGCLFFTKRRRTVLVDEFAPVAIASPVRAAGYSPTTGAASSKRPLISPSANDRSAAQPAFSRV